MRILPDATHVIDPAKILRIVDCGSEQGSTTNHEGEATDFINLALSTLEQRSEIPVEDVTVIAPWRSTRFARSLSHDPRLRGRLILQGEGEGYAGINFPYFAAEAFLNASGYYALLAQCGELGGFAWHLLARTTPRSAQ